MKPPQFAYHRPESRSDALTLLHELGPEGRVLAGGQSLVPLMNFRLAQPEHLVDIGQLAELAYVEDAPGSASIRIGASARQAAVERNAGVAARVPLLVEALQHVAHPPIRHRGTVCGSIAHADPAAELPAVAVALGATCVVASASGRRSVPAEDFILGPYATALADGELLEEVVFPVAAPRTGSALVEMTRTHGNFAVAGAAVRVGLGTDGAIDAATIVAFGIGSKPVRCREPEQLVLGHAWSRELGDEAAEAARATLSPGSDIHGSAAYRKRVAAVCIRRAVARAVERVEGGA